MHWREVQNAFMIGPRIEWRPTKEPVPSTPILVIQYQCRQTTPGLHNLHSVEGPGLKGGTGRLSREAQGEVHLDLDKEIIEEETSKYT